MKCIFLFNSIFSDGFFFSLCTLWGLNQCDKNKGALHYQEEATTKARPFGDPLIVLQCYAKGSTCLLRWEMARHFLPRLLFGLGRCKNPHSFCPQKPNPREKWSLLKNLNFQGCVWDTVPQTLANFPSMFSCQCLIPVLFLLSVPRASAFVDILSLIHFSLSLLLFLTPMP